MKPSDMTLQDFSRPWIYCRWTISILYIRRLINHTTMSCIVHAPGAVFLVSWCSFSHDRIFKTSFFKCNIPVIHTINQRLHPFSWCGRIDIVNNLLHWLYQFTSLILLHILWLWLQAPLGNVSYFFYALWIHIKICIINTKITNPAIFNPWLHWSLW